MKIRILGIYVAMEASFIWEKHRKEGKFTE
jgi:hypothetical protein